MKLGKLGLAMTLGLFSVSAMCSQDNFYELVNDDGVDITFRKSEQSEGKNIFSLYKQKEENGMSYTFFPAKEGAMKGDWAYINTSGSREDAIEMCKNYSGSGKSWALPNSGVITSAIVSGDKKLLGEMKKGQDEAQNSAFAIGWVSDDVQPQRTELNFVYSEIFEPQNPVKILPFSQLSLDNSMVLCHAD